MKPEVSGAVYPESFRRVSFKQTNSKKNGQLLGCRYDFEIGEGCHQSFETDALKENIDHFFAVADAAFEHYAFTPGGVFDVHRRVESLRFGFGGRWRRFWNNAGRPAICGIVGA